jgi:hypothetical protein
MSGGNPSAFLAASVSVFMVRVGFRVVLADEGTVMIVLAWQFSCRDTGLIFLFNFKAKRRVE